MIWDKTILFRVIDFLSRIWYNYGYKNFYDVVRLKGGTNLEVKKMNKNYLQLEKGKQIGIRKRILKEDKYYWYSYAVQKINDMYVVYEHEIAEENIYMEIDEYENIYLFRNFMDLIKYTIKYNINFNDLGTLKGSRIFNPNLYNNELM
jgi:hypothetical protein